MLIEFELFRMKELFHWPEITIIQPFLFSYKYLLVLLKHLKGARISLQTLTLRAFTELHFTYKSFNLYLIMFIMFIANPRVDFSDFSPLQLC